MLDPILGWRVLSPSSLRNTLVFTVVQNRGWVMQRDTPQYFQIGINLIRFFDIILMSFIILCMCQKLDLLLI